MKRIYFYFLLLLCAIVVLWSGSFADAGFKTWLSIDTALQNAYSKVRYRDAFKDLPDTMHEGDIFAKGYEVIKHQSIEKTVKFLETTKNYLNNVYTEKCEMHEAEVAILLYQHEDLRKDINRIINLPSPGNTEVFYEVFYQACKKLNKCVFPGKSEKEYETPIMLQNCVKDATTAYFLSQQNFFDPKNLKKDTFGENFLLDGNPDNGPFDLLVDIKYIGDILFKNNKAQPETVFFQLPEVAMPSSNSIEDSTNEQDTVAQGAIGSTQEPTQDVVGDESVIQNPGVGSEKQQDSPSSPHTSTTADSFINKTMTEKAPPSPSNTLDIGDPCATPIPQGPDEQSSPQKIEQLTQLYEELLDQYEDLNDGVDMPLIDPEDEPPVQERPEISDTPTTSMGSPQFPLLPNQLKCSALCSNQELAREYQSLLNEAKKQINDLYRHISVQHTAEDMEALRDQLVGYIRTLVETIATIDFGLAEGEVLTTQDFLSQLTNLSGTRDEIAQGLYDRQDRLQAGINGLDERLGDIAKDTVKTGQVQQEICEANCCMQTCKTSFTGSDKLICLSQCLCGEFSGPQKPLDFAGEWSPVVKYKVRFCRIPVETLPIIPKGVQSIEEILDEINNILTQLKESGQLMKHNKTKEMMETRLKTIHIADMFSFNLFIKFKPIFDVIPQHEVEQQKLDAHETWKQQFRDVYGDLSIEQERNKYLVMQDKTRYDATRNISTNYIMTLENIRTQQEQVEQAKIDNAHLLQGPVENTLRSKYYDEVATFVRNNANFRSAVTESMNLFNDTANALKIKIEESP